MSKVFISILTVLLFVTVMAVTATANQSVSVTRNIASMPLAFTENQGQWDDRVQFRANADGAAMWFTTDGAYYQFTRRIPVGQDACHPDCCLLGISVLVGVLMSLGRFNNYVYQWG